MKEDGLLTADGLKARMEDRKPITADDLKIVKHGFKKLDECLDSNGLSYRDFVLIIRVVAEISAQVGSVESAARTAEVLADLMADSDSKS